MLWAVVEFSKGVADVGLIVVVHFIGAGCGYGWPKLEFGFTKES